MASLFDLYFSYTEDSESPRIFHRWSMAACLGAFLGRRFWLPFGTGRIFPNQYVMLIGHPGSRKSTAIKTAASVLRSTGYDYFSANKTSKEKFLLDLEGGAVTNEQTEKKNIVFENLFGAGDDVTGEDPKEVFVAADEFNEFVGTGNLEFLSLLGSLWDWDDETTFFKFRLKNSKSVHIFQPTISIISGNTHSGFQEAFPPQAIGQGFLSRILLVYADPSGKKITFPKTPSAAILKSILQTYSQIREKIIGEATIAPDARNALDLIYRTWQPLEDQRFQHYSTRRFTHLLKLSLLCCAQRISTQITMQDVLLASSLLSFTETSMPKALGEFGKSRNSEAANKLMSALYEAKKPLKFMDMWKIVSNDLNSQKEMAELIGNLQAAEKIQPVKGSEGGYLPKQRPMDRKMLYVDFNLLQEFKKS